jgi:glycosyltransferase involved in cell wall biosynthesis
MVTPSAKSFDASDPEYRRKRVRPDKSTAYPYSSCPEVRGKFLFIGETKYWIKGVTYGTFRPRPDGAQFPADEVIDSDFAAIAECGFNTVRTYTPPPRSLLELARHHGLRVMVGLSWTQHVAFLDDAELCRSIRDSVLRGVRECANHPAVLCYAIGNEIPASIVRWHGRRKIERFLQTLYELVKSEQPEKLVTYVNFPTTEYLQLKFLDFVSFNVYLESSDRLEAYLARLQNLADERPLVLAEIGLDSRRNGLPAQAESIDWQIRSAFASGCAGAFAFSWTDEWHRGGFDIDDWDFGLTARDRKPKPALAVVSRAMRETPFPERQDWPKISIVVCSLNGAPTIRDTMEGLLHLDYPDYEVIVIDDGSTDNTANIAAEYPCRLISTENRGLSNARNTGWQEATGEIIAYIDDDAYPDPHWLSYLAHVFLHTDYIGVGGPNLAPPGDGWIADCIANAPGGPVHVLVSDSEAEHIPGCNMAFRRDALAAIEGFDPIYRAAGDDVDLCWRLQERGWRIGFSPAAVVWHHRRNSLSMYWKQQQGYGKAEALLEQKWPEKYNAMGHLAWSGRLYGKGLTQAINSRRWHIYQGSFGLAPFQSLYQRQSVGVTSLPLMPEWYLLLGILLLLALLGVAWPPLAVFWPVLAVAALLPLVQAVTSAARAIFSSDPDTSGQRAKLYVLTAGLHLLQPLARLMGRLRHGLSPWRTRHDLNSADVLQIWSVWSETWQDPDTILNSILSELRESGNIARGGGNFDDWDIEVRGGLLGSSQMRMALEEHGGGKQLLRFRTRSRVAALSVVALLVTGGIAIAAAIDGAWFVSSLSVFAAGATARQLRHELRSAAGAIRTACRIIGTSA